MMNDLEALRNWLWNQPAHLAVKRMRLYKFDELRYAEDYEGIWKFIIEIKKEY